MEEHELLRVASLLHGSPGLVRDFDSAEMVAAPDPDLIADTHPVYGADEPHTRPAEHIPRELSEQATAVQPRKQQIDLSRLGDGLALTWDRSAAYGPGELAPNARLTQALIDTAKVLTNYPHLIVVEGHTADDFVPSAAFPDAEAESFERARRAAAVLTSAGIAAERIQLSGQGIARPRNFGQTAEARLENRRVELRILTLPSSRRERIEAVRRASGALAEEDD
jgi:outer membrane protein OmpA-like peptidoglycan-associated protein